MQIRPTLRRLYTENVDEERTIEGHLSDQHRGSEVLRLSTKEYFTRVIKKEEQRKLAIKLATTGKTNGYKGIITTERERRGH